MMFTTPVQSPFGPGPACGLAANGGPLAMPGASLGFDRDVEIIGQGERPEFCFQVAAGCVRSQFLLEDGRRQVVGFLLRGDLFGLDCWPEHSFAAETVTQAMLRRFPLEAVEERADRDPVFARRLRRHAATQAGLARAALVSLGRKTAPERLAGFLMDMHRRLAGSPHDRFELPMCRLDIADHLGLTVETVCRGLTELRRAGTLRVDRARITVLDPAALAAAACERLH